METRINTMRLFAIFLGMLALLTTGSPVSGQSVELGSVDVAASSPDGQLIATSTNTSNPSLTPTNTPAATPTDTSPSSPTFTNTPTFTPAATPTSTPTPTIPLSCPFDTNDNEYIDDEDLLFIGNYWALHSPVPGEMTCLVDTNGNGYVDDEELLLIANLWVEDSFFPMKSATLAPTRSHTPTFTPTVTPTKTNTPIPPTSTPTNTPVPPTPTPTFTSSPTLTPTNTPVPAATPGEFEGETITIPLDLPEGAKPLEMVLIPAGTFMMGSPEDEQGRDFDETQHEVTISQEFYLGMYEVTQAQWEAVMGSNPSNDQGVGNDYPVYNVSWNDCQTFLYRLNDKGYGTFRLPTEAEWEYACRAGTTTRFYWGDDPSYTEIDDYAWYSANSGSKTQEVGEKLANDWGLHDMSGNVWEWCWDKYGDYPSGQFVDPIGPQSGSFRVLRGGGWINGPGYCRSAGRYRGGPSDANVDDGFRVVLSQTP